MNLIEQIQRQVTDHPVLLYMKGTPEMPLCGFSKRAVDLLNHCHVSFHTVDVLNPDIRQTLKSFSNWATFPQLYIKGNLIGGSDIIEALYQTGELQAQLTETITS
jgi:monothiol glutaredoxin